MGETRAPQSRRLSKTETNVSGCKPHIPLWEPASFILQVQASKKAGARQFYGSSEEKRKEKTEGSLGTKQRRTAARQGVLKARRC